MKRSISIRINLIVNLVLVVTLLSGTLLLVTGSAARSAIKNLSGKIIKQTIDQTETEFLNFFDPAAKEILRMKSLGEKEIISMNEPDKLHAQFKAIMQQHPQLTSVMLADDFGRQFMLLRKENQWVESQIGLHQQAEIKEWKDDAPPVVKTARLNYDPRERLWFVGATKKWSEAKHSILNKDPWDALFWTEPYIFFTSKKPGISASIRFESMDHSEYVIGFDILLEDIQAYADGLEILNHGQFMILTIEDTPRVVIFSSGSDPGKTDLLGPRPLSLNFTDEIKTPLIQDTVAALKKSDNSEPNKPIRFLSDGELWWGAGRKVSVASDKKLKICVMIPESDLLEGFENTRTWILVITAAVLIIGIIHIILVAARLSRPIESLVASSKQISKGDFNPGQPIDSNIYEVLKLSEAHDLMRKGLKTLIKLEGDIEIAREIQQKTLPRGLPKIPGFEVAGWNMPADETGGDTYDVIGYEFDTATNSVHIKNDVVKKAILLLGDATGHGLGPALSVAQIRAMLRMGVQIKPDIPILVKHINRQLHEDLPNGRFISAWLGQIDADTQMLSYFSAGQAPLLFYRSQTDHIKIIKADTYPLGISDTVKCNVINQIKMNPGDIFSVISDGIFEATNEKNELFGTNRVIEIVRQKQNCSPEKIIEAIRLEVDQFAGKEPANDDRTIIVIKRE